ncbi:hypothetical protein CYLTODRAFT_415675 [Cylindrobasidium torrendii FP15055 ss-10]|uniref:Uncharacterized protein n=1 Tax=Cylindrobasidium torrendii FP15055 ss-10 TaxID=1314674 RepID=A0A0D7ATE2_9AGAR|nr:hypothetical protein CYLTODRAFT_415675 [Cylindrobasidium torrendii FP15055 ss-10]
MSCHGRLPFGRSFPIFLHITALPAFKRRAMRAMLKEIYTLAFGDKSGAPMPAPEEDGNIGVQSPKGTGAGRTTVGEVEAGAANDAVFQRFGTKLTGCVEALAKDDKDLLDRAPPNYSMVAWLYKHQVDWRIAQDFLKANPKFHRHLCYNCVLAQGVDRHFFARNAHFKPVGQTTKYNLHMAATNWLLLLREMLEHDRSSDSPIRRTLKGFDYHVFGHGRSGNGNKDQVSAAQATVTNAEASARSRHFIVTGAGTSLASTANPLPSSSLVASLSDLPLLSAQPYLPAAAGAGHVGSAPLEDGDLSDAPTNVDKEESAPMDVLLRQLSHAAIHTPAAESHTPDEAPKGQASQADLESSPVQAQPKTRGGAGKKKPTAKCRRKGPLPPTPSPPAEPVAADPETTAAKSHPRRAPKRT